MKTASRVSLAVFVLLSALAGGLAGGLLTLAPGAPQDTSDRAALQGVWRLESVGSDLDGARNEEFTRHAYGFISREARLVVRGDEFALSSPAAFRLGEEGGQEDHRLGVPGPR